MTPIKKQPTHFVKISPSQILDTFPSKMKKDANDNPIMLSRILLPSKDFSKNPIGDYATIVVPSWIITDDKFFKETDHKKYKILGINLEKSYEVQYDSTETDVKGNHIKEKVIVTGERVCEAFSKPEKHKSHDKPLDKNESNLENHEEQTKIYKVKKDFDIWLFNVKKNHSSKMHCSTKDFILLNGNEIKDIVRPITDCFAYFSNKLDDSSSQVSFDTITNEDMGKYLVLSDKNEMDIVMKDALVFAEKQQQVNEKVMDVTIGSDNLLDLFQNETLDRNNLHNHLKDVVNEKYISVTRGEGFDNYKIGFLPDLSIVVSDTSVAVILNDKKPIQVKDTKIDKAIGTYQKQQIAKIISSSIDDREKSTPSSLKDRIKNAEQKQALDKSNAKEEKTIGKSKENKKEKSR